MIAPRPTWEMCELMCIELFLTHVCWQCSVFWSTCFLTLFQLQWCCIWIRHRDRWSFRAQRHSIRVFRCRTWQPIHSTVFLQLCRICVLRTCPEIFSTRAWQHCLTTWAEHEPIALLRCFTNAHDGKTDICFIVSDLATISPKPDFFPASPCAISSVAVESLMVPPSSHL